MTSARRILIPGALIALPVAFAVGIVAQAQMPAAPRLPDSPVSVQLAPPAPVAPEPPVPVPAPPAPAPPAPAPVDPAPAPPAPPATGGDDDDDGDDD